MQQCEPGNAVSERQRHRAGASSAEKNAGLAGPQAMHDLRTSLSLPHTRSLALSNYSQNECPAGAGAGLLATVASRPMARHKHLAALTHLQLQLSFNRVLLTPQSLRHTVTH
ncbi:hypothetical protein J6590_046759 [Homalodisca vitripennis]|nr:hypothetical protein J6590_046759 [Homalodisca vitripennis]